MKPHPAPPEAAGPPELPPCGPAFERHDHGRCVDGLLSRAEEVAKGRGVRLTPVRRRALEILLEAHRALGAYEILERLSAAGFGGQPPVAYRALDFLVEQGLAHRIRGLNAFLACTGPGRDHQAAFLICRSCGTVAETEAGRMRAELDAAAGTAGFRVERASIEAAGLCPACAGGAP